MGLLTIFSELSLLDNQVLFLFSLISSLSYIAIIITHIKLVIFINARKHAFRTQHVKSENLLGEQSLGLIKTAINLPLKYKFCIRLKTFGTNVKFMVN